MQRMIVSIALLCLLAGPAAAGTAFQFTLPGSQFPPDPNVNGFRLSLFHGSNDSVSGFDLGMVSLSESKRSSGISMIWGLGKVTGRSSGLASAFVNVHTGSDTGVNAAFINSIRTLRSGVNIGFVNVVEESSSVDISGLAISKRSKVQVGFVNIADRIDHIQIGFLNFAENGIFPVLPIFNIPR